MISVSHGPRHYPKQYRIVWIACAFVLFIVIAEWTGILYRPIEKAQQNLLVDEVNRYCSIIGNVTESKKGQSYFFMQLESGERLYVTVPYEYYDVNTRTSTVWYPTGTKIQVEGVLSLPDERRNPGGFDEAAWLLSKKAGVKLNAERISVLAEANGIWYMVYRLHNELERILYQTLSIEQADLAMALLTGAKHRLSDEFYAMTQRMGIAHIFAVSGLHVGVIGSVVLWSFHYMGWTRSWVSVVILAIGLGLYCMLAGLPASALRAAGMILLSALAIRLYRPPNAVNYLAFAAMVILLDNPFILWSAGFQLSFGVTLALLMFVSPIQKKLQFIQSEKLRSSIAVVLAAWLGSVPLTAWHFYTFSFLSPLFNFVLVPLVTMAVPLLLAGVVLSALLPMGMMLFMMPSKMVLWLLQNGTVGFQYVVGRTQWNIGQPDCLVMLLYIVFLILLWYRLQDKRYDTIFLAVIIIAVVMLSVPAAPKQDELLYLDTGQGSCAMLRTRAGEVVLFDTGAQTQELSSVLAWYGVNHIDAVILSHGDADHTNGLARVLDTVSVAQIYVEESQKERSKVPDKITMPIDSEAVLQLNAHKIVLKPFVDNTNTTNRAELTAVLHYSDGAAAFPGDLAVSAVQQFIAGEEHITIWTVPHHGSRNSGSAYLYRQLQQKGVQYAVISAGRDNGYGHPHKAVLDWIDVCKIARYSTAESGAILFILS